MTETIAGKCDVDRLVALVKSNDRQALDEITRCFGERLAAAGRKVCQNRVDADDVVQEALLAAGQNLQSFRGTGSLEGWLVRMVVNACHRMHRGRKNNAAIHSTREEVSGGDNPEALAERGEMIERLGHALLSLPPKDRAILLLAEAEDWTAPEIAEALELTPVGVRSRLMRARKKMRKGLSRKLSVRAASLEEASSLIL